MPQREHQRTHVLRLGEEFDVSAVWLLERELRGTGAGDRVRLDFRGVRRFHDYGIAALARVLTRLDGTTVKLEGLSTHHVRLLRYFGIDADVFRPDPEPGEGDGER